MSFIPRILKVEEYDRWNNFVDGHPEGTIFHKTNWLELIDGNIEIFTLWMNEEIKAGIALIKTKKNGITGYHIPPYTQYFSPLYGNVDTNKNSLTEEHECIKAVLGMIKNAKHIDFKLPKGHQSVLPYHWKGFQSSVSITHIITGTLAGYLEQLNKNKARELKKLLAMVTSGEIIIDTEITEEELTRLLNQTGERKGFDAKTGFAVRLILKADPSFAKKIAIRSQEHGLISLGFFPYDKRAVYNLINASVPIADPVLKTVNLLLLYKAIEFSLNTNRLFDFEGSMLPGVETFYRLMGGRQSPVYRMQKSPALSYSILRGLKQVRDDRKKT